MITYLGLAHILASGSAGMGMGGIGGIGGMGGVGGAFKQTMHTTKYLRAEAEERAYALKLENVKNTMK